MTMAARPLFLALLLSAVFVGSPLLAKPVQTDTPEGTGEDQASDTTPQFEDGGVVMPTLEDMKSYFLTSFAELCAYGIEQSGGQVEPEVWHLTFRFDGEDESQPARPLDLYQFFCNSGAYNQMNVYVTVDDYGEIRDLSFAEPELDIVYQEPDNSESPVESLTISGFKSTTQLVNATYDPETDSISTYSLWRGLGDAFSTAVYVRHGDQFVLKTYDVDASYDGEQTPERIVDYN
jgi:hypothetical protein